MRACIFWLKIWPPIANRRWTNFIIETIIFCWLYLDKVRSSLSLTHTSHMPARIQLVNLARMCRIHCATENRMRNSAPHVKNRNWIGRQMLFRCPVQMCRTRTLEMTAKHRTTEGKNVHSEVKQFEYIFFFCGRSCFYCKIRCTVKIGIYWAMFHIRNSAQKIFFPLLRIQCGSSQIVRHSSDDFLFCIKLDRRSPLAGRLTELNHN